MENKINSIQGAIWGGFTLILAVTLLANGIQSIFNPEVEFASWHLFTLAMSAIMTRASISDVQLCRWIIRAKHALQWIVRTSKKVARTAVCIVKAACTIPDLFVQSYNRIQTEP